MNKKSFIILFTNYQVLGCQLNYFFNFAKFKHFFYNKGIGSQPYKCIG